MFANKQPAAIHGYPFILESDVLSLSSEFSITTLRLTDNPLGITHRLQPQGERLLHALASGLTLRQLKKRGNRHNVVPEQIYELLGFLNLIGGLQRNRTIGQWRKALATHMHHLLHWVTYPALAWRRPATPWFTLSGVIRAGAAPIVASLLLAAVVMGTGLLPSGRTAYVAAAGLSVFVASLCLHELTHVAIILKASKKRPVLLQAGMRLGLLHTPLPRSTEIACALAGPAAGAGVAAAATIAAAGLHDTLLTVLCLCIALLHVASLLPWYGDGRSLLAALRTKEQTL